MGTYFDRLVAYFIWFCYERNFILSLSDNSHAGVIGAFSSSSRYLHDMLNVDNPYFELMPSQLYPIKFQLNIAIYLDTESLF